MIRTTAVARPRMTPVRTGFAAASVLGVAVLAGVVMVKLGEGERPGAPLPADDVDAAIASGPEAGHGTDLAEPERVH